MTLAAKLILFIHIFLIIPTAFASTLCDRKPDLIQCVATKNQFVLPEREYCNPYDNSCSTGDLIDPRVATCVPQFTGHIHNSLVDGFTTSLSHRCFPNVQSAAAINHRTVGPSLGQPQCVPKLYRIKTGVDTNKRVPGTFLCGEMGTRCVCSAPAVRDGVGVWQKNECRCQYFVDLCKIPDVCLSREATCTTWGSEVRCVCPAEHKDCRFGINHCRANPSLCEDEGKVCIELTDSYDNWSFGNEKQGEGFICMSPSTVDQLQLTTHYCDVTSAKHAGKLESRPANALDTCCYRMLTCAGRESHPVNGTLFSFRHCFCNVEFRKCLLALGHNPKYKTAVKELVRGIDNVTECFMDEGKKCDPTQPKTCRKGDLISPNVAHCTVDCKTGPLLPIWARSCSIRQCKPPNHKPYLRVIDVPDHRESSICKPVLNLPVECAKRGTNTRCVCDGKPKGAGFTDRCRCQYWPLKWET
ncbi:uncharacterized protein LOC116602160 isoform X1 [Nematostella vectensis]|uniref:uncharacterized protein LOC116602160 isoform X1 n=1 Tax=Nematostella vectensis TaxID=45351 RepID=UPI0013902E6E|nr:uncharacterized protein LOC116602160 isoform X1 [Nematostella vectensis]